MSHNLIGEIESYLSHNDHSLAIRRLLDHSLDADKPELVREAIRISRNYRENESGNWKQEAHVLLEKLGTQPPVAPLQRELLAAEGISKTYTSGHFSLKPCSLRILSGDIMGVVGENGNGKTTLLRCLAGQLSIDKGIVEYADIENKEFFSIKQKVAFIPQRIPRWYGYLRDNLHFSASIAGIHGDRNEWLVEFMLERLGLSQYAHLTWNQISSGYRTRFEIARVLLQRPTLLILDEPLANLDINAQQTILTDLRYMTQSPRHPMGVILSSQQLHEVEKVAGQILFIRNGECLFQSRTGEKTGEAFVLEVETTASREEMTSLLGTRARVRFNGGFYTLESTDTSAQELLKILVNAGLSITYARDITHSTKRFFN